MKVSVIIPLYNKALHVRNALTSISRQSYEDWEGIVVDDGSTDGSAEVAASFPDKRFRIIRQPNAGPGAARNRGITEARGQYLAFLDADDEWFPDYLDTAVRLFGEGGNQELASVTSGYVEYPPNQSREPLWRARGIEEGVVRVTPETSGVRLSHMLAYMSSCSTVALTKIVRRWGGFYESRCLYGEDAALWLKLLLNDRIYFHHRALVKFNRTASSLSTSLKRARPLEPFLLHPEDIRLNCPPHLAQTLERMLAFRAYKSAVMLGYWGDHHQARQVRRAFASWRDWKLAHFWLALAASTVVGGWGGAMLRARAKIISQIRSDRVVPHR